VSEDGNEYVGEAEKHLAETEILLNTVLAQSPPFMMESSETKRNREPKAPQDRIEESLAFRQGGSNGNLKNG